MERFFLNCTFSIIDFYQGNKSKFDDEIIILDSPIKNSLSRYSYILSDFKSKIVIKDGKIIIDGQEVKGDIYEVLRRFFYKNKQDQYTGKKYFSGGMAGIVSYDFCHYVENIPDLANDDLELPDCVFVIPQLIIVRDNIEESITEINYSEKSFDWNLNIEVNQLEIENEDIDISDFNLFNQNMSKQYFKEIVERAKEYIAAGDIFQVNLSQRFESELKNENENLLLYKILRKINPSPFASFIQLEDFVLISQSPERLVKLENGIVEERPIAGTRRKKKGTEDKMKDELLLNEKERAEHIMLVDLVRNDIGRVCEYGTVRVDELMTIENYSHVMHIVSNVVGEINENYDAFDLLKAVFPGGTIRGAPKVRSMEIIEELEPTKRGFYTGSVGFIDFDGNMDFNIIIRSFISKNMRAYFQVGAGIVFDSNPEQEYKETLNKGRAQVLAFQNLVKRREKYETKK